MKPDRSGSGSGGGGGGDGGGERSALAAAVPPSYDSCARVDDEEEFADEPAVVREALAMESAHHAGTMTQMDAILFIVGELAGAGLLALSEALSNTGVIGILLILMCASAAAYTGGLLGRTWIYLESQYADLSTGHVRQPYAEMGRRTYGSWMGRVILTLMNITLFGTSVVLLLVSAELIQQPAMFALVSVVAGAVLMVVQMVTFPPEERPHVPLSPPSLSTFCLGLSTIMFSFTGVSTFPTIQLDMAERARFSRAAVGGFAGLCMVYVPVAATGYMVYGDTVNINLIQNFTPGPLLIVIQVLLTVHFLGAFVMLINPVCQNLEGALHVSGTSGLTRQRVLLRSGLMLMALFMAETVPSFGKIMHLIGGTFTLMLTFILPSLLYIRLRGEYRGTSKHGYKRYLVKRFYLSSLCLLCVALSSVVVYYSVDEIVAPGTFQTPCYLRWWLGPGAGDLDGLNSTTTVTDVLNVTVPSDI
ncbi:amino acid transporter AVT1D-like isoform X2 [Amphibalanus amphitrite]|uniref:amino acid transporter AVT1D-like isoform X2 n=1 Tax=Amphibalanus amphitrite TaxID=1232801 RepID=UPI001C921671|nr:amino acid transporter AVT1D-like isoform X2 [Amphibalanus amphitrite]